MKSSLFLPVVHYSSPSFLTFHPKTKGVIALDVRYAHSGGRHKHPMLLESASKREITPEGLSTFVIGTFDIRENEILIRRRRPRKLFDCPGKTTVDKQIQLDAAESSSCRSSVNELDHSTVRNSLWMMRLIKVAGRSRVRSRPGSETSLTSSSTLLGSKHSDGVSLSGA